MGDYDASEVFKVRAQLELEMSKSVRELKKLQPMPTEKIMNVWEGESGLMEHVLSDFPLPRKGYLFNDCVIDLHDELQRYHTVQYMSELGHLELYGAKNISKHSRGNDGHLQKNHEKGEKHSEVNSTKKKKKSQEKKENVPNVVIEDVESTSVADCRKDVIEISDDSLASNSYTIAEVKQCRKAKKKSEATKAAEPYADTNADQCQQSANVRFQTERPQSIRSDQTRNEHEKQAAVKLHSEAMEKSTTLTQNRELQNADTEQSKQKICDEKKKNRKEKEVLIEDSCQNIEKSWPLKNKTNTPDTGTDINFMESRNDRENNINKNMKHINQCTEMEQSKNVKQPKKECASEVKQSNNKDIKQTKSKNTDDVRQSKSENTDDVRQTKSKNTDDVRQSRKENTDDVRQSKIIGDKKSMRKCSDNDEQSTSKKTEEVEFSKNKTNNEEKKMKSKDIDNIVDKSQNANARKTKNLTIKNTDLKKSKYKEPEEVEPFADDILKLKSSKSNDIHNMKNLKNEDTEESRQSKIKEIEDGSKSLDHYDKDVEWTKQSISIDTEEVQQYKEKYSETKNQATEKVKKCKVTKGLDADDVQLFKETENVKKFKKSHHIYFEDIDHCTLENSEEIKKSKNKEIKDLKNNPKEEISNLIDLGTQDVKKPKNQEENNSTKRNSEEVKTLKCTDIKMSNNKDSKKVKLLKNDAEKNPEGREIIEKPNKPLKKDMEKMKKHKEAEEVSMPEKNVTDETQKFRIEVKKTKNYNEEVKKPKNIISTKKVNDPNDTVMEEAKKAKNKDAEVKKSKMKDADVVEKTENKGTEEIHNVKCTEVANDLKNQKVEEVKKCKTGVMDEVKKSRNKDPEQVKYLKGTDEVKYLTNTEEVNNSAHKDAEVVMKPKDKYAEVVKKSEDTEVVKKCKDKDTEVVKKHKDKDTEVVKKQKDKNTEEVKKQKDKDAEVVMKPKEKDTEVVKKPKDTEVVMKPKDKDTEVVKKPKDTEVVKKPKDKDAEDVKNPKHMEETKHHKDTEKGNNLANTDMEIVESSQNMDMDEIKKKSKIKDVEKIKEPKNKDEDVKEAKNKSKEQFGGSNNAEEVNNLAKTDVGNVTKDFEKPINKPIKESKHLVKKDEEVVKKPKINDMEEVKKPKNKDMREVKNHKNIDVNNFSNKDLDNGEKPKDTDKVETTKIKVKEVLNEPESKDTEKVPNKDKEVVIKFKNKDMDTFEKHTNRDMKKVKKFKDTTEEVKKPKYKNTDDVMNLNGTENVDNLTNKDAGEVKKPKNKDSEEAKKTKDTDNAKKPTNKDTEEAKKAKETEEANKPKDAVEHEKPKTKYTEIKKVKNKDTVEVKKPKNKHTEEVKELKNVYSEEAKRFSYKDTEETKKPKNKDTEDTKKPINTETEEATKPKNKETEEAKKPKNKETEEAKRHKNKETEEAKKPKNKDSKEAKKLKNKDLEEAKKPKNKDIEEITKSKSKDTEGKNSTKRRRNSEIATNVLDTRNKNETSVAGLISTKEIDGIESAHNKVSPRKKDDVKKASKKRKLTEVEEMPRGKRRKLEENHQVVQLDSTNKDSLCNQNTEEMNSSAKKLKLSDTNETKLNHTDIKVVPKFEFDAFKKDKDSKDCNFENSLQENVCIKTELSNDHHELTKLKCEYKVKCETSTTEQNIVTLEQPQDVLLSNMYCESREAYLSCQTSCHPNISTTGNNYIPNSQATEIGQPSWRGIDSSLPDFTALINKMTDARQFLTTITMQSNIEQAWAQNASFQLMDQFETHYKEIESTFKKKETHHFFHLHKMSRSRKETYSKNYRRLKNAFSNFKSLYQSIKENIYFKKSQMLSESVGLVESDSIAQDKNSEAMKSMAKKQTITSNLKQNHTIIPPAVEYISPQVQPVNVLHESAITNANCSLSSKTVAHQNVAEAYYHHYPYSHVTNSSQPNLPHAEAILPDYTSLINKIADASRFLRSITVKAKNKQLSSQKASFQLIDQFADNFKDVEFNYKNEQQNYDIMFSKLSKLDKTKHRRNFTKLKHLFCDLKNRYLQLNKSISERKMKLNSTDNQCWMEKKQ